MQIAEDLQRPEAGQARLQGACGQGQGRRLHAGQAQVQGPRVAPPASVATFFPFSCDEKTLRPELGRSYAVRAAVSPTPVARAMIETWGLTPGQLGRIEPSATQTPSTPRRRPSGSTG